MKIDIITLFPKQIADFLNYSIIKRAIDEKKVEIKFHDLRKWAIDKRGSVDDKPYGGGHGMILRCEPVVKAICELRLNSKIKTQKSKPDDTKEIVVIFDARGKTFNQQMAFDFSKLDHLILICGHYEGFDERILNYVDMAISIGEYVLTGGEIPALVVADAVTRIVPGVLKPGVVENESFSWKNESNLKENKGMLGESKGMEYPQYTRPEEFEGHRVPDVLLSGDHGEVDKWRKSNG